jgi:hypothetical protein
VEKSERSVVGIGDAVPQTVGTKNTYRTQCSTVTLGSTFLGRSVTILDGQTIRPLLGLSVTWSERFGSYPSEVSKFGS